MKIKGLEIRNKHKEWSREAKYSSARKKIKKLEKTAERRAIKEIIKRELMDT
jgi:hypothetical protein